MIIRERSFASCMSSWFALRVVIISSILLACLEVSSFAMNPEQIGGGGAPAMPSVNSFPGQGAGSNSPTGRAFGATVGHATMDYEKGQLGRKCRFVRGPGGSIPECP